MRSIRPLVGWLVVAIGAGCSCGGLPDKPVPLPEMPSIGIEVPLPDVPQRYFDFWLGEWDVQNKHLRDGAWVDSGNAIAHIQPVVDGGAVLEQWNGQLGGDPYR